MKNIDYYNSLWNISLHEARLHINDASNNRIKKIWEKIGGRFACCMGLHLSYFVSSTWWEV